MKPCFLEQIFLALSALRKFDTPRLCSLLLTLVDLEVRDMHGREPSESCGDVYASTARELLQLLTQTKAALKYFKVFKGFTTDPFHNASARSKNITLRVHWDAADSARGVFGVQDLHKDLVTLSAMLHRVYLAITGFDVDEWYPSIKDLENRYIDLDILRFGVGRILIHSQRGHTPQNIFEAAV